MVGVVHRTVDSSDDSAPTARDTTVAALGLSLADGPGRADSLRHLRVLPRRAARTTTWPAWAHPDVVAALR
ncbi:MAG: hypothetical protein WB797_17695, partial [Nocardioides sp.]